MKSVTVVQDVLAKLKVVAESWRPELRTVSVHGTLANGVVELLYTDVDVLFLFEDACSWKGFQQVDRFFAEVCGRYNAPDLRCIYRIESGPMHPMQDRGSDEKVLPLTDRPIVFFHVSLFPLCFFRAEAGLPGPSRLLLYSWSKLLPLVGEPIRSLRSPVDELSLQDVLNEGLGIRDLIGMIENGRRGYWAVSGCTGGRVDMVWREEPLDEFEQFELALYAVKWVLRNSVRVLKQILPLRMREDVFDPPYVRALIGRPLESSLDRILSAERSIQGLRAAYTADPGAFHEESNYASIPSEALEILHRVERLFVELASIPERGFLIECVEANIPITITSTPRDHLHKLVRDIDPDRILIVTDSEVDRFYDLGNWIGDLHHSISQYVIAFGEKHKSIHELSQLLHAAEEGEYGAGSLILVLGGGNVGNLGGMAAGLLCRGTSFVHIPTSLVAQLDSAIGLKQSVNGWHSKNFFGLFHPPQSVLVDPAFLTTLPEGEIVSGLAEALKHGLCQSAQLVDQVIALAESTRAGQRSLIELDHVIHETIRLKLEYMVRDPRENAIDQFLELGHKIGHAFEHLLNGELSHGFSIAAGMIAEARFFEVRQAAPAATTHYVTSKIRELVGTVVQLGSTSAWRVAEQLLRDNKRRGTKVPFAYLRAPQIPTAEIIDIDRAALTQLAAAIDFATEALS